MALEGGPAPLLAEDRALGRGEFLAGISKWVGKEGGRVNRVHESLPAEHFPCGLI